MTAAFVLWLAACAGPATGALAPDRIADADHDRSTGAADRCPDAAEDEDGFQDDDGCPEENDTDGIADADDLCPTEAEDFDGFEDGDGCPDPDDDQDRIVDADDACPREPEVYNGFEDEDGCPDDAQVEIYTCVFPIIERVYFRNGSSDVLAASIPIIDALAAVLDGNPDIELTAVVGHAAANERHRDALSEARATAVFDLLVARGVDSRRLVIRGAGARARVADGRTAEDHERNRRVELRILERSGRTVGRWNGSEVVPVDAD